MNEKRTFTNRANLKQRLLNIIMILVIMVGVRIPTSNAQASSTAAPVSTLTLHVNSAADSSNVTQNYNIHKGDAITQF